MTAFDPFGSLADDMDLDDALVRVTEEAGTQALRHEHAQANRSAAVEAFAGWSSALDPAAAELRARVWERVEAWLPGVSEAFETGTFPRSLFRQLGDAGAIGASLVGRGGQPPLSRVATCAVMHALEYGDGGLRCALTVHDSVIQALVRYGSDEQRARWLGLLCEGEALSAFALTETAAGSDIRALGTRATRSGGDWLLSGAKSWVTNGPGADVLLVWARTSERHDAIRGFLVERGTAGLEVEPIPSACAMRVAPVGRVRLDRVRVPDAALLPHAWGLVDINACLDYNRLTVLFGVMGGARRCLDLALEHAGAREQFGVPLAAKQLIQTMLADMAQRVALGELASLHLAQRWDHGPLPRFDISLVKRSNCVAALEVARMARAMLGAGGIDLDRHVMRHLLNFEASYSYGGTHEIHGLVVGKELTRESAF